MCFLQASSSEMKESCEDTEVTGLNASDPSWGIPSKNEFIFKNEVWMRSKQVSNNFS